MLEELGNDAGYLKAGFLGFPKSGKTYTSALLAIGTRTALGLGGPIAMFDTEGGASYVAQMIVAATGQKLLGRRARSFDDLMAVARECETSGVSVLIVDSVTHVWREICDAYLKQVNEQRAKRGRALQSKLEFQDWAVLKAKWAAWTDFYLNSRLHIIICGRAGYEYDYQERDDDSGKKDLVKTGTKMKVESEFGFEPSLLVEMERVRKEVGGRKVYVHNAKVLGDRFALIDAKECDNPTFEFFAPHVLALNSGNHAPIDTEVKSDLGVDENGDADWNRERRQRAILAEEIQGELLRRWPGQTTVEKSARADAVHHAFGTRSWTKVESMNSDLLRVGLEIIRGMREGE